MQVQCRSRDKNGRALLQRQSIGNSLLQSKKAYFHDKTMRAGSVAGCAVPHAGAHLRTSWSALGTAAPVIRPDRKAPRASLASAGAKVCTLVRTGTLGASAKNSAPSRRVNSAQFLGRAACTRRTPSMASRVSVTESPMRILSPVAR